MCGCFRKGDKKAADAAFFNGHLAMDTPILVELSWRTCIFHAQNYHANDKSGNYFEVMKDII